MKNIKITVQYLPVKVENGDLVYKVEKNWNGRPAWINLLRHKKSMPRFLSVDVPGYREIIYKVFGHYYYPIDYTNNEEQRFMDAMAREYDEMVANKFNIPMAKALLSRLLLKEIKKDARILDLGCGTGIMSELLIKKGFSRFELVDFSKQMLERAGKKLGSSQAIKYGNMDITKELPKGMFDLVVSVMLFNTFDNKTIKTILSRLVKHMPKGALFGLVEDAERPAYTKYFRPVINEMVDVGIRTKYIFVGIKK